MDEPLRASDYLCSLLRGLPGPSRGKQPAATGAMTGEADSINNAILFGGQGRPGPLGDDLPEFPGKLVAVARQSLIKRALGPVGCLLSRLLVLRGFALVLL
jgi:hypothetical protein